VNGYLHLPKNVKRPPLIIWANGIDTHKADIYARLKHFTDRGIAVLTVDTIGTGENSQWPAAPGGEAMLQAVIDKMQNDKRVDGKRIGHIGISFGGHFAARLAAVEPRLKAVAALCAPVHEQFARGAEWYAQSESETTKALAAALRVDSGDFEAIAAAAAPLSLVDAGILGAGKTIKTPLLVANGDKDALVPLSDMTMLAEAAEHSDLWIMGGSGHCAGGYGARFYPNIAEWFLPYLSGDE
jgi:esterase FrsA